MSLGKLLEGHYLLQFIQSWSPPRTLPPTTIFPHNSTHLTAPSYVLGSFSACVIKVTNNYLMNSDLLSQMFT